jgi:hypothetical protein
MGFIPKKIEDGKRAETSLDQRPRCNLRERCTGTGVNLYESAFIQRSALLRNDPPLSPSYRLG